MSNNRTITKIKHANGETHIEWEQKGKSETPDRHKLTSDEGAMTTFDDAMNALRPHIAAWLELPESWGENLDVRGVSFSHNAKTGIMGATITALKPLDASNSPMVVNTPHKPEEPYAEGGDPAMCLSSGCVKALERVTKEAEAFLDGHRAQMSLEYQDGPSMFESEAEAPEPVGAAA